MSAGFTYNPEMMTGRWKNWVVVFIAFWLPLQGYGAVAMPFCEHGPAMPASSDVIPAHVEEKNGHTGYAGMQHHDHPAVDHHAAAPEGSADKPAGPGCNDCGACHLACAPLIVSAVPHVVNSGSPVYDLPPAESLKSVSPEQLQRPPLSALN